MSVKTINIAQLNLKCNNKSSYSYMVMQVYVYIYIYIYLYISVYIRMYIYQINVVTPDLGRYIGLF